MGGIYEIGFKMDELAMIYILRIKHSKVDGDTQTAWRSRKPNFGKLARKGCFVLSDKRIDHCNITHLTTSCLSGGK
jgi:hypothetical protein